MSTLPGEACPAKGLEQRRRSHDLKGRALSMVVCVSGLGVGAVVLLVFVSRWAAFGAAAGIALGVVGAITTHALATLAKVASRSER